MSFNLPKASTFLNVILLDIVTSPFLLFVFSMFLTVGCTSTVGIAYCFLIKPTTKDGRFTFFSDSFELNHLQADSLQLKLFKRHRDHLNCNHILAFYIGELHSFQVRTARIVGQVSKFAWKRWLRPVCRQIAYRPKV